MSMIITDKTVGIWYLQTAPKEDWVGTITEVEPDKEYELVYRFRYYKDTKAFDSEDEKSWYSVTVTGHDKQYVIESVRALVNILAEAAGSKDKPVEFLNTDGVEDFMNRFMAAPFVSAKAVPVEQA